MHLLDMRTVVFGYAISNFICMTVMAVLWTQNRRRFAGTGFWVAGFMLQFSALALLALRGIEAGQPPLMGSNALAIGGLILIFIGLEHFTGKRGPQAHNAILLAGFVLLDAILTIAHFNLAMRNVLFSLALLAISSQCAWLMLRRVGPVLLPITRVAGYVFAAFCLVSLIRSGVDLAVSTGSDFYRSDIYDTLLIITYQMLYIILTFSLFLMVNRRLFTDLENDTIVRERAERIVRLRLTLWEFLSTHPVEALMQKALDEIEALTGSLIGFYHFVEEDQNTLSLQAWSTRTLEVFCVAEGKGMHYPISEAGVWVDCVHQRKPVIHNDYASLPQRKGLPEGHAEVIREAVVPTLRGDRVVSVLGVGNKPSEYDEHDVELVAYIADLVWSIVEQKRADDEIRQLNNQLERMAMTDELTGLTNRRSFFLQGVQEIKKAQHHQTPFSLLMLDLDDFKSINDRYGHEVGDRMLQCVANTLLGNIRKIDLLARLGGEEFSVMLPDTGDEDAVQLAERLRLAVAGACLPIDDQSVSVTVSIGVASYNQHVSNINDLLKNADTAMYQAKNQGRNRVVLLEKE